MGTSVLCPATVSTDLNSSEPSSQPGWYRHQLPDWPVYLDHPSSELTVCVAELPTALICQDGAQPSGLYSTLGAPLEILEAV